MKIKLYQINHDRDEKRVGFMDLRYTLNNGGVDAEIYDCVFDGEIDAQDLEDVFRIFNIEKPENYYGRSMSVSDVVHVIGSGDVESGFYYCDNIGFGKIEFKATETA